MPPPLVEYDSAALVPEYLFDLTMLGKDLILYGETNVRYQVGRDTQGLWRVKKEKDPTTVPLYHARLPVYSWMSCPVTINMYQLDEHTVCIGTTNRWDKKVYPLLSLFLTPLIP